MDDGGKSCDRSSAEEERDEDEDVEDDVEESSASTSIIVVVVVGAGCLEEVLASCSRTDGGVASATVPGTWS